MKFGAVEHPEQIDFRLPDDNQKTSEILSTNTSSDLQIFVGCAKWNSKDLKGFYPKVVTQKKELPYYASQFNSIELNATFYNMPSFQQVEKWKDQTPAGFKFCPKITNTISHYRRLIHVENEIETYCNNIAGFEDRLGTVFLQLHDNFQPKDFDRLKGFLEIFPKGIPLAVEVRNQQWYADAAVQGALCDLLENLNMSHILVDTAGRRDLLHMRLTNKVAFVRFVGANVPSDSERLQEWVSRIALWRSQGLETLYFFIHQNVELESPLLATCFIQELNKTLNMNLQVPRLAKDKENDNLTLF